MNLFKYFKVIILILTLNFYSSSIAKSNDSNNFVWLGVGGNSSLHIFNKTPVKYKMINLFSRGFEFTIGFQTSRMGISIGYRHHCFKYKEKMYSFDSSNQIGFSAEYSYLIESIPIKWRIYSKQLKLNFTSADLGFSLNRGNFNSIVVELDPNHFVTYSNIKRERKFEALSISGGINYERKMTKFLSVGILTEVQFEVTRTYEYENQSQMSQSTWFENPHGYSKFYFLASIYVKYELR